MSNKSHFRNSSIIAIVVIIIIAILNFAFDVQRPIYTYLFMIGTIILYYVVSNKLIFKNNSLCYKMKCSLNGIFVGIEFLVLSFLYYGEFSFSPFVVGFLVGFTVLAFQDKKQES